MLEEASPDDVLLGLFYSDAGVALALLLAKPRRRSLRDLVAELQQEQRRGEVGLALVVAPRQAGELYHVAAPQASMTKPYVLLRVHRERWRAVFVVRKWAAPDPFLTNAPEATSTTETVGQVDHRHGLFGCVYGSRVGNAAISLGARLGVGVYNHV